MGSFSAARRELIPARNSGPFRHVDSLVLDLHVHTNKSARLSFLCVSDDRLGVAQATFVSYDFVQI